MQSFLVNSASPVSGIATGASGGGIGGAFGFENNPAILQVSYKFRFCALKLKIRFAVKTKTSLVTIITSSYSTKIKVHCGRFIG
jgi:hypothetical protein